MKVAIILCAGEGTRMKSNLPKVLHKVSGEALSSHVIDSCRDAGIDKIVLVCGYKKEKVIEYYKDENVLFAIQEIGPNAPYGTGFAVMCADEFYKDDDTVIVLNGDAPLITKETIEEFLDFHEKNSYVSTVLTAKVKDPYGYGRIVRNESLSVERIVEEKDATELEKKIHEINSGIFAFSGKVLRDYLKKLDTNNVQGELYLTDILGKLTEDNVPVGAYIAKDSNEIMGANSRLELEELERLFNRRNIVKLMENGVSFINMDQVVVEKNVEIGEDSVIYPGVVLQGNTKIGKNVLIYGNSRIDNSIIGNDVKIDSSTIEDSEVGDETTIGPNAHLRPKSKIGKKVKLGNFVEVKNSTLGDGTKASHLAYIGDADVGSNVNIGCGVIFVNYDGKNKFRSVVHDHGFVGSNSNIVAPVEIEEYGYVAAGSTITKNVSKFQLSIERSHQKNIDDWVKRKGLGGEK